MTIVNLTKRPMTPEQQAAGYEELFGSMRTRVLELLTFEEPPSKEERDARAMRLAWLVRVAQFPEGTQVLIGCTPYMAPALVGPLRAMGYVPVVEFEELRWFTGPFRVVEV